jgi:hypothetical protein
MISQVADLAALLLFQKQLSWVYLYHIQQHAELMLMKSSVNLQFFLTL